MNIQDYSGITVTAIIPSYKPEKYLWKCLESLYNQTLPKEAYEVLLILNGCNEPYYSRTKDYVSENLPTLKIRLIQTDAGGVSNARNIGIEEAKGEYIAFIDDDDFVSPTYLEELLHITNADTVGISNELRYVENNNTTKPESFTYEFEKKSIKGIQPYYNSRKVFSAPWMKMIHRDVISSNRFDTRYTNGEDSLFMFQISRNVKYVNYTSPNAIYYRRVREGSAMSKERGPQKMIANRLKMIIEFIRIYLQSPRKYNIWFLITRILGCLHSILNSLKHYFEL